MQHGSEVKLSTGFSAKARQIRSLCMQHESEVKMSRGFSAKARQIRSLCMQHESEVKMSRGADMTTDVKENSSDSYSLSVRFAGLEQLTSR